VISVGLPFLVFELASSEALRRARPDRRANDDILPLDGATSIYVYTRDSALAGKAEAFDLQSRMFTRRMRRHVRGRLQPLRALSTFLIVEDARRVGRPQRLCAPDS
jgi:hypothetical protein